MDNTNGRVKEVASDWLAESGLRVEDETKDQGKLLLFKLAASIVNAIHLPSPVKLMVRIPRHAGVYLATKRTEIL